MSAAAGAFTARYEEKVQASLSIVPQTGPRAISRGGFVWSHGITLPLASPGCLHCKGLGLRSTAHVAWLCNCVLRSVFRACWHKYHQCSLGSGVSQSRWAPTTRGDHARSTYGRKAEEFRADFYLIARRTLDHWHWRVFEAHFLWGMEWRECVARLQTDRGHFFNSVYRVERDMGRALCETRPYALFPIDEYFNAAGELPVRLCESNRTSPAHFLDALAGWKVQGDG